MSRPIVRLDDSLRGAWIEGDLDLMVGSHHLWKCWIDGEVKLDGARPDERATRLTDCFVGKSVSRSGRFFFTNCSDEDGRIGDGTQASDLAARLRQLADEIEGRR